METKELYADIVVPLAQQFFTFSVPSGCEAAEGSCVSVQLGKRKIYTGIVWRLHDRRPPYQTIKPLGRTLYARPLLTPRMMRLWEWIADYYMCPLGDVMRAAFPSALKPEGLSDEEFRSDEFRPRTETCLSLAPALRSEDALHEAFELLGRRARAQYAALMEIVEALGGEESMDFAGRVARRRLGASAASIKALEQRGFIAAQEVEVQGAPQPGGEFVLPDLTPLQQSALEQIESSFAEKETVLLHGVTGSGKTEIYMHAAAARLARGEDVLLLLPEIALTSQLIERFRRVFGPRVTAYHSKLSDRNRTETYLRLAAGSGGNIVVGVRSALFLPLDRLSLIIVDEEHDASFKQSDPAPRYNARDCASVYARLLGGKALLGSATPAVESYFNALAGRYGLVTLTERYGNASLPAVMLSDTLRAVKRNERHAHFNRELLDRLGQTLERGEQAILFQNRRGYSPYIECDSCGWTARCPDCNVTLTLHKSEGALRCHYCGFRMQIPPRCPACKTSTPAPKGFGTEKVEEELARLLPSARIARLDRDSARTEKSYSRIIGDFASGATDILVGTQMITKGFDFSRVSLVGILNADNMLCQPDFRAAERAYQLMTQVAGRAGRRDAPGQVVIQTSQPQHPVTGCVVRHDYQAMVRMQLAERQAFCYPPFSRLIAITLRHADKQLLRRAADTLAAPLRRIFGRRLLGPEPPAVDRIKGESLLVFTLKIERGKSAAEAKALLAQEIKRLHDTAELRSVAVQCNVDPL